MRDTLIIYLFVALLPFFSFSNEKNYCGSSTPWQLPICAKTKKELSRKSDILYPLLVESLRRKTALPEAVRKAGKAVFNIGIQNEHSQWKHRGGSGFFLFNVNTFYTNHHVLSYLFKEGKILNWNEVIFRDQTGDERNFKVTGVKFVSAMRDVAVLSVEDYNGPVLDLAMSSPEKQSYIIGYPYLRDRIEDGPQFRIQSVHNTFDVEDIHYGTFPELLDSYYRLTNFGGSSGGPMINRKGKVEAVFSNAVSSRLTTAFLLTRKINFLTERLKNSKKIFQSIQEAKEMMIKDKKALIRLAQSENPAAQYALITMFDKDDLTIMPDLNSIIADLDHILMRHLRVAATGIKHSIEKKTDKKLLHTTWYELGAFLYYEHNNLQQACRVFWKKAGELGHPYVRSNFVIIPYKQDVIYCEHLGERENGIPPALY